MYRANTESVAPWCVFIIDDSPEDRAEIRRMLLNGSERRLRFIEADTAASALRTLLGTAPLPACIVLDYNLPDMDAPELLAALLGSDGITVCPVVVLTGGASREDGKRVLRAGAQDYVGKDWTSPQALSRSLENACESWAMARELRERGEALRIVTDREQFFTMFDDSIRVVHDERELRRVASRLLGLHLGADWVAFAEVLDDGCVVVEGDYTSGVEPMNGMYRLDDYGPLLKARFQAGENVIVTDVRQNDEFSPLEKLTHAKLEIMSYLAVPILQGGKLVTIVGAYLKVSRIWSSEDALVARDVGTRAWAAIAQLRAEAKLLASRVQLSQIVAVMPSFSAVFRGPAHVIEQANQAFYDFVQCGSEMLERSFADALPELAGQALSELMDAVYRTGEKFDAKGLRTLVQRNGDRLSETFIDIAFLPLRDTGDRTSGIFLHGIDRTAEIRSTRALAQRERELRSVTDNTPDGLVRFDREFRLVFVNAAAERTMGRKAVDVLGSSYRQLGMELARCEQWEATIQYVFDHETSATLHFSLETPSHGVRSFASRVVPEFSENGLVSFVLSVTHDITEEQAAQDLVRRSEARFEVALANTQIMVYTADHDLRYTWIRNPHPDFDASQILGRRDDEIVSPEAAEPLIRLKQAVLESGIGSRGEFAIDLGGTRHHYDLTIAPLRGTTGHVEGVTVAAMDITDRKLGEELLRDADRRKNEFLATLAHELRNPLAPIRTGLELLKSSAPTDLSARILPMMGRQLEQLVRLIDDLMDVSRINSGKFELRRERVSFQEVAAVALEASRQGIDAADHLLTTDWPEAPVWLDADPTRLAQTFGNLLNNAAKYTRSGGQIRFSAVPRGDQVVISVQDTGVGIAPESLGTVFDMFTQISSTRNRAQGGLGIGLSLVKTLVGMHGGHVEAISDGIDQGSTFTVTLPMASAAVPEAPPAALPPPNADDAGITYQRILVVDDNVDAAETMVMLLTSAGHTVRAVFAGEEALRMAPIFRPDVVFLDIGLPGMSGYDVARALLADSATAAVKLMALSGWGAPADIEKSRQAGFHAHLTKPINVEALRALLVKASAGSVAGEGAP